MKSFEEVAVEAINLVDSFADSDGEEMDPDRTILAEFGEAIPWMVVVEGGAGDCGRVAQLLTDAPEPSSPLKNVEFDQPARGPRT
ncbi:MAG: hypothetical protein U1E73_05365 [Planctomycetota bacterium]